MKYINNFLYNISNRIKNIEYFIKESLGLPCGIQINENKMTFVANDVKLGNKLYRIAVHKVVSGDRPYPHVHIYMESLNEYFLYTNFDFEISLVDLLCVDNISELRCLVCQIDKLQGINRRNRKRCDWAGYRDLEYDFESWLYSKCDKPGNFIDNLDFLIYTYNRVNDEKDSVQNYIKKHHKKILPEFLKYFN